MSQRWTKERAKRAHLAKARIRMAEPPPDYPPLIDYNSPVESFRHRDYRTGEIHDLVLFPSRRRINAFRVVVNGREWKKSIGYDRLLRGLRVALSRRNA